MSERVSCGENFRVRETLFKFFGVWEVMLGDYFDRFDSPHFSSFFGFSVGDESWGEGAKYFWAGIGVTAEFG